MPTIQDLNDLNLKIANAKTESAAFAKSIDPTDSTSWWVSLQNNCGVTWKPNTPAPACSATFKCTGAIDCKGIWNLITARKQKIAENDANILVWQGQVDAILKDPTIAQQIEDADKNRMVRNGIIVTIVVAAIIGVFAWLDKKYFHIFLK